MNIHYAGCARIANESRECTCVTDYQKFTTRDMPKAEREKFRVGDIWANTIKCLKCGDVIRSKNRHHFVYCKCGAVFVDGGSMYQRTGGHPSDYINLIEYYDDV